MILLGDAPYYARFGFSAAKTAELSLPGPFERDRLLGLELREGALDGAWGMIVADRRARAAEGQSAARKGAAARAARGLNASIMPMKRQPDERAAILRRRAHHHHHPGDHDRCHDRQGHLGAPPGPAARPLPA